MNAFTPSKPARLNLTALLLATGALSGCASGGRGELPFGEWSGRGAYVYREWAEGGPAATNTTTAPSAMSNNGTLTAEYDTWLKISPDKLGDTAIVKMEIRSKRTELPGMEDETHLVVALVPADQVTDNARLYRAIAMQLNPSADEPLRPADDAPPFIGTCMTRGDVTQFQIMYMEKFIDSIRFQGWNVEKCGVFHDPERGMVHWTERLTRKW